jgi:DNA-3-methyladenine glycosylase
VTLASPSDPLPRSFFGRTSLDVARDLLGRHLVKTIPDGSRLVARLVEVEAYRQDDPASHSYRGRTPRTDVMFGPPGYLYVYFTYGMHYCMNVVTGREGEGSAVLLRAAEPLEGVEEMARRRGVANPRLLLAGPARMCEAFGVSWEHNGLDLADGGAMHLERGDRVRGDRVVAGPRVGITAAVDQPWRFVVRDSPYLSRRNPSPPRSRSRRVRG